MSILKDIIAFANTEGGADIASPYSDASHLEPAVVIAEALGLELSRLPLGRQAAIQIPAVARSRNLLVGAIAPLPLVALDVNGKVAKQPSFLSRSNSLENPYDRMAWTIDDLLFHGLSLWAVERGAKSNGAAHGPILDAVRVPRDRWKIQDGQILVQTDPRGGFEPVDSEDVVLFNAPTNGLLSDASSTLKAAQAIEAAYVSRARNPIPLTVIRHTSTATSADQLTEAEATKVITTWKNARRSEDGAVGYLPPSLQLDTPGTDAVDMLQEARNAVRIDIANHANIPVSMLDGAVSESSLTYRNAQGEVSRFYGDLNFWLDPIQHRLSMDDVVPRGQRIRFDLSAFDSPAPEPTGVPTED